MGGLIPFHGSFIAPFWRPLLISGSDELATPTIIKIKPHYGGWKVFEAPGIEPYFSDWDQAIHYASGQAERRAAEIRVFDDHDKLQHTIQFDDSARQW